MRGISHIPCMSIRVFFHKRKGLRAQGDITRELRKAHKVCPITMLWAADLTDCVLHSGGRSSGQLALEMCTSKPCALDTVGCSRAHGRRLRRIGSTTRNWYVQYAHFEESASCMRLVGLVREDANTSNHDWGLPATDSVQRTSPPPRTPTATHHRHDHCETQGSRALHGVTRSLPREPCAAQCRKPL